MAKLWEFFKKLFFAILAIDPQTRSKQQKLKEAISEIKSSRLNIYSFNSQEVLPIFAEIFYKIALACNSLGPLFEKTIFNQNHKLAERYRDLLVESRLPPDKRKLRQQFTIDQLRLRLRSALSFEEELKKTSKDFEEFLALFRQPEYSNFDREYLQLLKLAELTRFDFERLLSNFDPELKLKDHNFQPNFSPIHGRQLIQDLMDYYFQAQHLKIDESTIEFVLILYRALYNSAPAEKLGRLKDLLVILSHTICDYLPPRLILALLKIINEDPDFNLDAKEEPAIYLELYKSRLLSRFELDREKLLQEYTADKVDQILKKLWPDGKLLPLNGFSSDLEERLAHEDLPPLAHLKPLAILKTFFITIFEPHLKKIFQTLFFNAFFEDRHFKEKFLNLFHALDEASLRFKQFEQTMADGDEVSLRILENSLTKYQAGKSQSIKICNLIETLNKNSLKFIEEISNTLSDFTHELNLVLEDSRQHSPLLISNIKVIGGEGGNNYFLAKLTESKESLVILLEVMKNFTVLKLSQEREETLRDTISSGAL